MESINMEPIICAALAVILSNQAQDSENLHVKAIGTIMAFLMAATAGIVMVCQMIK